MFRYRYVSLIAVFLAAVTCRADAQSPPPPPPPAPPACSTADYRAFDFWVGEWDVYANGSGTRVATSSIEAMFAGCAIRETWKPLNGPGGGSFSHYDAERRYWRQMWVDGSGVRVDFDGGPTGGKMVLTGNWPDLIARGQDALIRMTYTPNADGSVRQHGEQSLDYGLTWAASFDFIYKPHRAEEKRP